MTICQNPKDVCQRLKLAGKSLKVRRTILPKFSLGILKFRARKVQFGIPSRAIPH